MRIGIVLYPTFGGSGVVATELGKALAKKGHEIHFITYSQPVRLGSFRENIFYHEVSVSDYPLFDYQPYELVLASKLVDVVQHEKLDLLHVHYAIPHAYAAHTARSILKEKGIHIPYITTLHGTDITLVGRDPSFEPVITYAINHSDAVTAVSESLKKDTYEHFKIDNGIEVIPNFIRESPKVSEKAYQLKDRYAPNGEKIVCHISNFRKVKRVDDVVRVFKKIRDKMPAKLLFVGDGPERANVEQLCRELGTCGDTYMLGKLRTTNDVLAISDLFLLTSETESFGLAALEAMANRVPVVSTNTGGIPEVNLEGFSGMMSDVGDVDKMGEDAIHILSDDARLEMFKNQAYEQSQKFCINKILPQYEALYKKVVDKTKRLPVQGLG